VVIVYIFSVFYVQCGLFIVSDDDLMFIFPEHYADCWICWTFWICSENYYVMYINLMWCVHILCDVGTSRVICADLVWCVQSGVDSLYWSVIDAYSRWENEAGNLDSWHIV